MKYVELNKDRTFLAKELFDESIKAKEISYKAFEKEEDFHCFFVEKKDTQTCKISLIEEKGEAFASGCYVLGEERAYITFVTVKKERRRQGIGRGILEELERILLKESGVKKTEIIFFNPMAFSWYLTEDKKADHPNAPGIDVSSCTYLFFKNCGYRDYATQNSYYIDLSKYKVPNNMAEKTKQLQEENITFEIYNEEKHYGLKELILKFDNSMWEKDILGEAQKGEDSRPIIIVSHKGKTIGFTGPLDVEQSGRGYFAGIGVDSDYRGKGIAKVLFCELCVGLANKGAKFMTLFTGETNPARNIYEAAGFRIVRTWADMRKEWKDG